jgi:hypothetical protein
LDVIRIRIKECRSDGKTWESRHRTADHQEAIDRAIIKQFGKGRSFYASPPCTGQGPNTRYGQIGHYVPKYEAASMDTDVVRIDIEEG